MLMKTQAEIYQALLDGKTLKYMYFKRKIKLINGMVHKSEYDKEWTLSKSWSCDKPGYWEID